MIPKDIDKEELILLMVEYDRYIQDANDEDKYSTGWHPVCINEFYDNEFQEIKDEIWRNISHRNI